MHESSLHDRLLEPNSGGLKYDSEKPCMDLLDSYALEELAKVLTFGAKKYEAHNWRKGFKVSRLVAAALRHLFAFLRGETKDPETGLDHVAHAMCCCMFIVWQTKHRPELDDRWKDGTSLRDRRVNALETLRDNQQDARGQ